MNKEHQFINIMTVLVDPLTYPPRIYGYQQWYKLRWSTRSVSSPVWGTSIDHPQLPHPEPGRWRHILLLATEVPEWMFDEPRITGILFSPINKDSAKFHVSHPPLQNPNCTWRSERCATIRHNHHTRCLISELHHVGLLQRYLPGQPSPGG